MDTVNNTQANSRPQLEGKLEVHMITLHPCFHSTSEICPL